MLGPSGCGKSTLLRAIADLVPLFGRRHHRPRRHAGARRAGTRNFSFVFQDATLLPWRSAIDNVRLPLEVGGGGAALMPSREELLELVGLKGREKALPGGTVRRHAPARRDRPRAGDPAEDPADGRALRRARRDHPRQAQRGTAAHLAGDRDDDHLRHPLDPRGGLPRPARARARSPIPAASRNSWASICPIRAGSRMRDTLEFIHITAHLRELLEEC